ncbi:NAD(P)H-dependent flavin oxidoreductase [Nocardia blacklockiae]|uniref:NAD(P)H-dependent flavin oxidoreductase n=1 Tax=Nocardia blacklockiae TaxID=480036 RepID=UPI001895A799|nr:nitronate monooxygenase [Nocardia blacklockiae]MBF6173012.1 nitronate monooxygenase [Nocardia blacklockiae]
MALETAFTQSLSIRHPIALAPMGGVAGGALAAAVSQGGGLGLIGGGRGDREQLAPELALARAGTDRPWGIGFLSWGVDTETLAWALDFEPAAVLLSFGDPTPFAQRVLDSGAKLILQVTDLEEARGALDVGADILVAQGGDAGGHSGGNAVGTLSFVPVVVDMAGPTPVLAAGGIADGRGLAAVLALGAAGALIGTRFEGSPEALLSAEETKALLAAHGHDTESNRTLDIARGAPWPDRYPARTLRNAYLDKWRGRDDEVRTNPEARREFQELADRNDLSAAPVWAGQGVGLVTAVEPAADIVEAIAQDAERTLHRLCATQEVRS